jgi:hypothetical protein
MILSTHLAQNGQLIFISHSSKNTVFDNFHFSFRSSSRRACCSETPRQASSRMSQAMALSFLAQGGDGQQEARIRLVSSALSRR